MLSGDLERRLPSISVRFNWPFSPQIFWGFFLIIAPFEMQRNSRVIQGDEPAGSSWAVLGQGGYNPFGLAYSPEEYYEKQVQEIKHCGGLGQSRTLIFYCGTDRPARTLSNDRGGGNVRADGGERCTSPGVHDVRVQRYPGLQRAGGGLLPGWHLN